MSVVAGQDYQKAQELQIRIDEIKAQQDELTAKIFQSEEDSINLDKEKIN